MPLIVQIGPGERPRTDIESRNLGLITAWRSASTPSENQARDARLLHDLYQSPFGFFHVRGRYIDNNCSAHANSIDVHAYLVLGHSDDSGNLKGFLRKAGRNYEQDAIIHKGYYRDAELYALRDLPDLGMSEKEKRSLGLFSPDLVGHHYTLITRRGGRRAFARIEELRTGPKGIDWLGGVWEDIGYWTRKSFFARHERRVYFENECS